MNLQQLEYIIAVERERHFVRAAEKCFVTQATLSTMVKKLEDELGIQLFDRSQQPVRPTREGVEIIELAKKIVAQTHFIKDYARELKEEVSGELRLAVIPTIAPYLLPLFLKPFQQYFPHLKVHIRELISDDIVKALKRGDADVGILATPLNEREIREYPLFYEEFFPYASASEILPKKKYLLPNDINPNHLWLLEEGHCLRDQLLNFCTLKKSEAGGNLLRYEVGSIQTLINMVDSNEGITILPKLATERLTPQQQAKLRAFAPPKPAREVSLITVLDFPRKKLLQHLKEIIMEAVKGRVITDKKGLNVLETGE
ncbi:MAG: LysR substrate-binding domain-containing protein [Saprospiraceae bacterium]|jgi:LysR family hydrogen peroxide-inducible transcriptional activator|nr:LysR substrate-binding domain-containing protein [Saprospiraceae bacterium]